MFNIFRKKPEKYSSFDQENHYRPRVSKAEFYRLKGFDFGWYILQVLKEQNKLKDEESLSNVLSACQKALWFWWYIDGQVTNGGFIQFYYNGYEEYAKPAIVALKSLNINDAAELIESSYKYYLKNKKKIHGEKYAGFFGTGIRDDFEYLSKLDNAYYKINDSIMSRIEEFVKSNPNEVCKDEEGNDFNASFTGEYENKGHFKDYDNYRINLKEGKLHGKFISYFPNGNIKFDLEFEQGNPIKEHVEYNENGQPCEIINYSNWPKTKTLQKFSEEGIIQKEESRDQANKLVGQSKRYYGDGQLKIQLTYNHDSKWIGDKFQFWSNGYLMLHSRCNEEGQISFIAGQSENGEDTLINGNGHYTQRFSKSLSYHEIQDYKMHGKNIIYDIDGKIKTEYWYKNGLAVSDEDFV